MGVEELKPWAGPGGPVKKIAYAVIAIDLMQICLFILTTLVLAALVFASGCNGTAPISNSTGNGVGTAGGMGGGYGAGTGGGMGKASGGGTGNSGAVDNSQINVYFILDCTMTDVHDNGDTIDTSMVKVKGNVPFLMDRDWHTTNIHDLPEFFGSAVSGKETHVNIFSEWNHHCKQKSEDCMSCHYKYTGPAVIDAEIQHLPSDAPDDWSAQIIYRAMDSTEYTTSLEPSPTCDSPEAINAATMEMTYEVEKCWEEKHMSLTDGSIITYTSSDPDVTLDSTAVFHV
jgi:hypothetical protein